MRRNGDPLTEARDPLTPPERLWRISHSGSWDHASAQLLRAAVSNPNFPIDRLVEVCLKDFPPKEWDSVIDNPSMSLFLLTASPDDIGGIAVACAYPIEGELKLLYEKTHLKYLGALTFYKLCEDMARGSGWFWGDNHPQACRLLFHACVAMAAHEAFVATSHRLPFEVSLSPKALGYIHYAITDWKPDVMDELRKAKAVPKCVAQSSFTPNRRSRR
jgi:hypothetical protein